MVLKVNISIKSKLSYATSYIIVLGVIDGGGLLKTGVCQTMLNLLIITLPLGINFPLDLSEYSQNTE